MAKQKQSRTLRKKQGGKKSGLLETAAAPFGLFAIQHLLSKKLAKTKKRKRTNKNKRNKKRKTNRRKSNK